MGETNHDSVQVVKRSYVTFVMLLGAWIVAWVLKLQLDQVNEGGTDAGSFMYWTSAKLLIWILPAWILIRVSGRNLKQIFNFSNYKGWFLWGGGIGFGIALTTYIPNYLNGRPLLPTEFSYALLNVLIISPIFEEFLLRGAMLGNLQQQHSFWGSNLISSFMFVVLHLPGWFFAGSLVENVTKPAGGAASIFLLGLMCGYAVKRGNSVMGGMLAHFLNNLH